MKTRRVRGPFFVISVVVAMLSSCYVGGPGPEPEAGTDSGAGNPMGGGPVTVATLSPPSWIKAEYSLDAESTGVVHVSWEAKFEQYSLYRRLGAGEWTQVGSTLSDTTYDDLNYYENLDDPKKPKAIQYAVRTTAGNEQSDFSAPSVPTAPMVLGLRASIFAQSDGIPLTWDEVSGAVSYNVYRSTKSNPTAAELECVCTGIVPTPGEVTWTDVANGEGGKPAASTLYYYLVTWVKNGTEFGKADGLFFPGAYYASIDHYEPNEEWASLLGKATSLFFASQAPFIYEINDGHGNVVQDKDWYVYNAEPGVQFAVRITLPPDTPFDDDELLFRFYYAGALQLEQGVKRGASGINEYTYAPPPGTSSKVPVYFGVRTGLKTNRNVIGSYTVEIVSSF